MTERMIADTIPGPEQPLEAARAVAAKLARPLVRWNGMFFAHTGQHYERVPDEDVIKLLYNAVEAAFYEGFEEKDGVKKKVSKKWPATPKAVMALLHALKHGVVLREAKLQPVRCTALADRVLEIGPDRQRSVVPHSPDRFNLSSASYSYDGDAQTPMWQAFLAEVLPDEDDRKTLQEYFGYCMSDDTSHQVMLSLSGKKRSGKGTILRILTALVGEENRAAGSLKRLTGEFGLAPLLGKTLLTFGDVRWNIDTAAEAVQLLLEISGEDAVQVNIKNRDQVSVRLGVRIVFAGNNTPRVSDPSGAFAERLLCLTFRQSFAGREDRGLEGKLKTELPGILNWALDGADRLAIAGRFTQSAGATAARESIEAAGQGSMEFVRWCLVEEEGGRLLESELMAAHETWAADKGRKFDRTSADTLRPVILEEYPAVTYVSGKDRISVRIDGKPRKANAYLGLVLEPGQEGRPKPQVHVKVLPANEDNSEPFD